MEQDQKLIWAKSSHKHGPRHGAWLTQASAREWSRRIFTQRWFATEVLLRRNKSAASSGILRTRFLCDCNTSRPGYGPRSVWTRPVSLCSFGSAAAFIRLSLFLPVGRNSLSFFPAFHALMDGASHSKLWSSDLRRSNVALWVKPW